jgi:tetratricopeptide (TPR) repeat protein
VDLLRDLLAARFPVIVETGTMFEGGDWLGHYKTLVGYDDLEGVFYIYDSWLGAGEGGAGRREAYSSLDEEWRQFNRAFIVVFEQDREPEVRRLLGDLADPTLAAENALVVAQEEALANNQDVYAWFNIGTALTKLGRYDEAARAYDRALQIGRLPWRMIWYQFGPFEAYFEVGRYDDVLALVNTNLTNGAQYVEETHYWQGRVFEVRGDIQAAINSYTRALQHNPRYAAAREARDALTR